MRLARFLTIPLALLAFATSANAVDIYDTMVPTVGGNIQANGAEFYIAGGFTTTANGFHLTDISMQIFRSGDAITGNVNISIYITDGGYPPSPSTLNTTFYSAPVTNLPNQPGSFDLTGLNVTLTPSTDYYLVVDYLDASAEDNKIVYWNQATGISNSNPIYDLRYTWSSDATTWNFPQQNYSNPLKFKITADANSVPEPSTYAMAAIASGVMAYVARRRKANANANA